MNLPKNIIIVGGNGKVGSIIRDELSKYGSNIFVLSRSGPVQHKLNPFFYQVDATDASALKTVIDSIQHNYGLVTGLVNCASYRPFANSEELINSNNIELWSRLFFKIPTFVCLVGLWII